MSFQLPDGWSTPVIVEDTIVADGITIHRAGISAAGPNGEEACGAAAEGAGSALPRARYELLERICTIEAATARAAPRVLLGDDERAIGARETASVFPDSDAPARWRFSSSNGVALHRTWRAACERAFWELAERDRVLRSWYGEITPSRLVIAPSSLPQGPSYDWRGYVFEDARDRGFSRGVAVVGVFGLPMREDVPYVFGLGARPDRADALAVATREALQGLAFLWGEAAPSAEPAFAPTSMFHLDAYQVRGRHETVRRWLDGAHAPYGRDLSPRSGGEVVFVDLTPGWLEGGLRVAKAICEDAVPLVFGDSPYARHLSDELRIHPIA